MKILVCGDVHLTNYSDFNQPTNNPAIGTRLNNILTALYYFFDYGKQHDIDTFVINGDFYDQRQRDNPTVLAYIQNWFNQTINDLLNNSKKTYYIYFNVGNHDQYTRHIKPNALQNFKWYFNKNHHIEVIDSVKPILINDEAEFFFVPYSEDIEETKDIISDYLIKHSPNIPVTVFAHLGVNGAVQGRWSHRLSSAFNLQDLAWDNPDIKNIVLGHYHSRQSLKKQDSKEAWYVGDLTELNFNDIQKNGYGAPRGFDVVDTEGGHTFVDLTKAPYNLPTFNSFDLDKDKISTDKIIDLLKHENYVRLMVSDKDKYEKLSEIVAKEYPNDVQLILKPQPNEQDDIKIDPNTTDNDLVAQYCEKHYPEIKDQALEYLRKAKES